MPKPPRASDRNRSHSRPQRSNSGCNHKPLVYLSAPYIDDQPGAEIILSEIKFDDAHLAPLPRGVPADNLLLAGLDGKEITVSTTVTGDFYDDDFVELLVNGVSTGTTVDVGSGVDIKFDLPAHLRRTGTNVIYYLFYVRGGVGNPTQSPLAFFNVDLTSPGQFGLPSLEVNFTADDELTEDKLEGIKPNRFLATTIPGYEGLAAGDVIKASISGNLADGSVFEIPAITPNPIRILFPETAFQGIEDGEHEFTYTVKDRAGNVSPASPPLKLYVRLKGAIGDLRKPEVPKANDGIINAAEARAKLQVIIPEHLGERPILPDDQIVLVWGQFQSEPIDIPPGQENRRIPLTIAFEALYKEWKRETDGADRAVDTDVYYKIVRDQRPAGTSEKLQVRINLFHVGGDPSLDPDNLLHPKLLAAALESASGKTNEIPPDDFNNAKDATVKTPSVNSNGESIFLAGDTIDFWYGSYNFKHPVKAGEGVNGKPIETTLLGSAIKAEGTGIKFLEYAITREVDGPTENTSQGPQTPIFVDGDGGGTGPEKPPTGSYDPPESATPEGYYTIRFINEHDIYFIAPAYEGKAEGDIMTLQLIQYWGAHHGEGETRSIPATLITDRKTVEKGEEGEVWKVLLPKEKLLAGEALSHMHSIWTVTRNGITEQSDSLPHIRFQTQG